MTNLDQVLPKSPWALMLTLFSKARYMCIWKITMFVSIMWNIITRSTTFFKKNPLTYVSFHYHQLQEMRTLYKNFVLFVRDKYFKNYFRSIVKMQKSLKKSSIPGVPPKLYSNLEWVEVVCWKIFWNYLIPE